ncbi:hypothetical protein [Streptomyces chartreusis]|uniref:DUF7352 domain-containing protein n=1 Tax=Streptomyces chartreusis TaxID=1969 RepID=UPI0037DDBF1C|nr:hypothetical protein OG938_48380 [Streptomyces chartreusis]
MPLQDVIHRAELPIDDRPHGIDLTGDILHAAVRRAGHVDVWYLARRPEQKHMGRSFQVVGTGQPLPAWLARHHATAITPDDQFVWHVLESHCPHDDVIETTEWGQLPEHGSGLCRHCPIRLQGDGNGGWIPA